MATALKIEVDDVTRTQLEALAEAQGRTPQYEAEEILRLSVQRDAISMEEVSDEELRRLPLGEAFRRLFCPIGLTEDLPIPADDVASSFDIAK